MNFRNWTTILAVVGLVAGAAVVLANEQSQQMQNSNGSAYEEQPEGWVFIGYDYDNDGRFDSGEYMHPNDIECAHRASRQRRMGGMEAGGQEMGNRNEGWTSGGTQYQGMGMRHRGRTAASTERWGAEPAMYHIQGQVTGLKTIELSGMEQPHLLAKVETSEGKTARVDLGPKSRLSALDLEDGDSINVFAIPGKINDKSMLMACRVDANGEHVNVRPMRTMANQESFRGVVIKTRTASFRGFNEDHVVARIRLDNGAVKEVDLGRKQDLKSLDLQRGEDIHVRGCPGRINGQPAVIAEVVRANGQTVDVPQPQMFNRPRAWQAAARYYPGQMMGSRRVEGRIDHLFTRPSESGRRTLVARITTQDGRTTFVKLGPSSQLSDFKLQPGDQVNIFGRPGWFDNHHMFIADRIQSRGESVTVEQEPSFDSD